MAKTPDNLTQAEYRGRGYHVIKVEQWGMHPELHRTDFLGIFDYLVFNDAGEMIAIQTTTKHNMSERRKKMLSSVAFSWWTKGGRRAILHGWECINKQRGIWKLHEEELTMDDWNTFQAKKKEIESTVDKKSPLYRELFPNGHE